AARAPQGAVRPRRRRRARRYRDASRRRLTPVPGRGEWHSPPRRPCPSDPEHHPTRTTSPPEAPTMTTTRNRNTATRSLARSAVAEPVGDRHVDAALLALSRTWDAARPLVLAAVHDAAHRA